MNKRGMLLVGILLLTIPFALAVERGEYWNKHDKGLGTYSLEVYPGIVNYDSGSGYEPVLIEITNSSYLDYEYEMNTNSTSYTVYFQDNIQAGKGIRFEKNGYYLTYDLSGGKIQWAVENKSGTPDYGKIKSIGSVLSASVDIESNHSVRYNHSFSYTDILYQLGNEMLKENFILNSFPPGGVDYLYLEYTGEIQHSDNLTIYANGEDKTGKDFNTTGSIEFRDENNETIFYLPKPYSIDSDGNSSEMFYDIKVGGGKIQFGLRVLNEFLENATYPVYIDPSIKLNATTGGQDVYVDKSTANRNHGDKDYLKVQRVAWQRTYLTFNLSAIPDNQVIDNASVCLYMYNDQGQQNLSVNHVYDNSWCEGDGGTDAIPSCEMTWNNQPCGTEEESLNESFCNTTAEDILENDGTLDGTWQCWSVREMIDTEYSADNESISMVIWTTNPDSADIFYSKEYSNSSLWPYLNITYHLADMIYPTFSNYQESPSNGTSYSPGQLYEFNVTLNETNLYEIGIEFEGVNYTSLTNNSNIYSFNRSDLAAGTYTYYWWAKDIVGNYNTSSIQYYTVSKATPTVTLLLNSAPNNLSLTYLQQINATALTDGGTLHLYRDGTNADFENSVNRILAAGYYQYKANVTGNQNYTDSSGIILYLNISKKNPSGNMKIVLTPSSTVDYGTQTSATASEGNIGDSDLTYQLYREGNLVANPNVVTLDAGTYNYVFNTTGGENYSQGTYNITLTVNKLDNPITLLINGIADNLTTNSSQQVNVTAYSQSGTINLYKNGIEVSAENSVNITLGEGYYQYYANSTGNTNYKENTTGITFYVNVTPEPPILDLYYPTNNSYIPEQEVYLNYTVTDQYLDTCELWIGTEGNLELNQTSQPSNGSNYFTAYLSEGNYSWGIVCNDTGGRETAINQTFAIDPVSPNLTLSQPSGTKSSRSVQATWNIADTTPLNCWYNVYKGASPEIMNTTINCTPSSTSFSVSSDGNFIFNFYVNDSAGNLNSSNLSFTVNTYVAPPPSGGGGGGGGGSVPVILKIYELEINNISDIIVDPGENKRLVLKVKNTGTMFLNECRLKGIGDNSEWVSSTEVKGLGAGESYDFTLNLNVPEQLEAASYKLTPSIICEEANASVSFNAEIIEKKLSVNLISVEKNNENNKLKVIYSLTELSDVNQQVEVDISLINEKGEKTAETKESKTINAGSTQNFQTTLESENQLIGNYDLIINALSETSSAFYQEEIVLGDSRISGLAILDESRKNMIISAILVGGFVIFAIIVLLRIWKFRGFKKRTNIKSEKH